MNKKLLLVSLAKAAHKHPRQTICWSSQQRRLPFCSFVQLGQKDKVRKIDNKRERALQRLLWWFWERSPGDLSHAGLSANSHKGTLIKACLGDRCSLCMWAAVLPASSLFSMWDWWSSPERLVMSVFVAQWETLCGLEAVCMCASLH